MHHNLPFMVRFSLNYTHITYICVYDISYIYMYCMYVWYVICIYLPTCHLFSIHIEHNPSTVPVSRTIHQNQNEPILFFHPPFSMTSCMHVYHHCIILYVASFVTYLMSCVFVYIINLFTCLQNIAYGDFSGDIADLASSFFFH